MLAPYKINFGMANQVTIKLPIPLYSLHRDWYEPSHPLLQAEGFRNVHQDCTVTLANLSTEVDSSHITQRYSCLLSRTYHLFLLSLQSELEANFYLILKCHQWLMCRFYKFVNLRISFCLCMAKFSIFLFSKKMSCGKHFHSITHIFH